MQLKNWSFEGLNKDGQKFSSDIILPNDSASILLENDLIADPYYAQNELDCRWIAEREWVLTTQFDIDSALLGGTSQTILDLSWLDTHASVYLNDILVQTCTNLFTRYLVNLSAHLRSGENELKIILHPILELVQKRAKSLPFPIPSTMGNNNKFEHMNLVRKVQCHAGWDWGITLMVAGIYQAPELVTVDGLHLSYLTHSQHFTDKAFKQAELTATAHVEVFRAGEYELCFEFAGEEQTHIVSLEEGEQTVEAHFQKNDVQLWWPAGHGHAHLYPLQVRCHEQSLTQKIGLRHIKWDNSPDDIGNAMTLMVNGRAIFCKGANWIPCDAMPSRQIEKYDNLLDSALAANMNMVRIWGGGQYEHEQFYALCDEKGLLVWQDMMFACALYPSEPWFLAEVGDEIKHQIRRLNHHPSIVLYCGDNEVVGALDWYEESRKNKQKYTVNYDRLNRHIATEIARWDESRNFWPSSPCNGALDYGDGWHDDSSGDMHFWDVWHSGASFEAYHKVKPRFCSEFGFQSFSSLATVSTYLRPDQYNISSPDMEHHQKNARGNSIILEMFSRYFRIPSSFPQQIYLSQLQQSLAISLGVEYWRTTMPVCMGTVYWQLNDNWPVSSWSSLEYGGRWKQLHYHIKRAYHPVLVAAHIKDDTLEMWLVSDKPATTVAVKGGLYNMKGELVLPIESQWSLDEAGSKLVQSWSFAELAHLGEQFRQELFLHYTYQENGQYIAEKTLFLSEPKKYALLNADVETDLEYQLDLENKCIVLVATKPFYYLWLECDSASLRFSENSITLLPHVEKRIYWQDSEGNHESIKNSLRFYYLNKE